jgi:hypothetical protein
VPIFYSWDGVCESFFRDGEIREAVTSEKELLTLEFKMTHHKVFLGRILQMMLRKLAYGKSYFMDFFVHLVIPLFELRHKLI